MDLSQVVGFAIVGGLNLVQFALGFVPCSWGVPA